MFYPSMTLFLGFGALLVLWVGSREVIRGRITLGEFVAFNSYLVMLSWPMIAFGWVTNMLQRGMASWKRMLEVLDAEPEINDAHVTEAGRTVRARLARIEIRDLTFTYPGTDRPVLDDVSLRIEPGQTVAFVGATGSGKSTLISLLPRLHEPPPGTVFIGWRGRPGDSARAIARRHWLRAAGAVSLLGHDCREHGLRRSQRRLSRGYTTGARTPADEQRKGTPATDTACTRSQRSRRLDKDVESFPQGLRDDRWGARHHALGRPETADRAGARASWSIPAC